MGIERRFKINPEWMTSIERIRKRSSVTENLRAGKVCISASTDASLKGSGPKCLPSAPSSGLKRYADLFRCLPTTFKLYVL